jgi:hypothetical protein
LSSHHTVTVLKAAVIRMIAMRLSKILSTHAVYAKEDSSRGAYARNAMALDPVSRMDVKAR